MENKNDLEAQLLANEEEEEEGGDVCLTEPLMNIRFDSYHDKVIFLFLLLVALSINFACVISFFIRGESRVEVYIFFHVMASICLLVAVCLRAPWGVD